jgi:hypothetical protein
MSDTTTATPVFGFEFNDDSSVTFGGTISPANLRAATPIDWSAIIQLILAIIAALHKQTPPASA